MAIAIGVAILVAVIAILIFPLLVEVAGPELRPTPTPMPTPMPTPVTPLQTFPSPEGTPGIPAFTIAAHDSSASSKSQADYVCDGVHDEGEINAALYALPRNGGVVLMEGTFNCGGVISPKSRSVLCGQGDDKTTLEFTQDGHIQVDSEYVALEGFTVSGTGYSKSAQWFGVVNIQTGHVAVRNVTGTCDSTIHAVFSVLSDDSSGYNKIIEDIEFTNCKAIDCGGFGFINNAWGTTYKLMRNVRYNNCQAINCGRYSQFNPWVTGFDFAELNDIEDLQVTGCYAEGCWESGFHIEWDPEKTNCVFIDCVSKNNGQKPYPYDPNTQYFGSGYYTPRGEITFYNCVSEGNSKAGFCFENGGGQKLYGCTDLNCAAGRTDYSVIKPASYYVVGPRSGDPSLILQDCSSIDSNGYGLYIIWTKKVYITNFTLTNPAGINGVGATFGDSSWSESLTDSEIDLCASGNRAPSLIVAYGNQNTKFTGKIISDVVHPFTVDGSQTRNVEIKDMEIISNTLPTDSTGITVTGIVPVGAVRMINSHVISPTSSSGFLS